MTILGSFTAPRRAEKLPVTLVTGFLGSGKTTLVNHILSNRAGVRAAVLVNELGDIGIDNDLIVAAEGGMIELSNGCICCATNNDLLDSIVRVLSRSEPVDHILVETTGVADPLPVAQTFQRPEFRDALRLDAIVAVADAEQFSLDLFDSHAVRSQLRHADAILINKCDRVGEAHLGGVMEHLIPQTVEALKPFDIQNLITGHCTGWRALHALADAYGERVSQSAVGTSYLFDAAAPPAGA